MRILGLIPARGGSKGIPRKNIRSLAGKPLIQYTIEAAKAAERLDRTVLSTDDPEIVEVGRRLGVEVPFVRPGELASDETPMLSVVRHALLELEGRNDHFDAVTVLQPTSPKRRIGLIDECIAVLEESGADSVITITRVPDEFNPRWTLFQDDGRLHPALGRGEPIARRQDLPPAYRRDGAVYAVKRDIVIEGESLYGHDIRGVQTLPTETVNLDTWDDWAKAEFLLSEVAT